MISSLTSESRGQFRLQAQIQSLVSIPAIEAVWRGVLSAQHLLGNLWAVTASMAVISFVAAYDTYLTLKYAATLHDLERNPLGRWLMSLDCGPVCDLQQIAAFVTAKFVGTFIVLLTIQVLAHWRLQLASTIALTVALFQLWLAYHLTFAIS